MIMLNRLIFPARLRGHLSSMLNNCFLRIISLLHCPLLQDGSKTHYSEGQMAADLYKPVDELYGL